MTGEKIAKELDSYSHAVTPCLPPSFGCCVLVQFLVLEHKSAAGLPLRKLGRYGKNHHTKGPLLPLPNPKPEFLDDGELLRCQCSQRRFAPGFLLRKPPRVSAAVEVVPVCKYDVGAFVDISDDVSMLWALV